MEQRGFVSWFRQKFPGVLIFYINNGASHVSTGKRLKDMGAVAGIPDLCIPEWNVWVEMKTKDGGCISQEQQRIHIKLERIGHTVITGNGAEDASRKILSLFPNHNPYLPPPPISIMESKSKHEVGCSHCGHKQMTSSKSIMITCSSCQKKTKNALNGEKFVPCAKHADVFDKVRI